MVRCQPEILSTFWFFIFQYKLQFSWQVDSFNLFFKVNLQYHSRKRRPWMRRKISVCFIILGFMFIFFSNAHLEAEQIYTWTDKDGNLHITEYPPPEGAKLKEVTSYSKKPEIQKSENQERPKARLRNLRARKNQKKMKLLSAKQTLLLKKHTRPM